ncbi:MAG: type IV pili twitching motility protein PilT [Firmicutes bacterium HGW-Firmicutes-7]|nr:MAG: type IV pili twitching motility protein PilT [Firmicutes bacterium HGW-Firmicutes-7]
MISMEELLREAKEKKASDLHITVGVPPILRINGDLQYQEQERLLPEVTGALVESIMSVKQKEHFDEYGEVDFSFSIASIGRFRVNAFKQRGSVAAALRLVDSAIPDPVRLGLPPSIIDLYTKKRGLILVTGPTGSGKSTTLASLIGQINKTRSCHVITLEDPIEYLHSHNKSIVNQREMGLDSMSYSNALRAALRQDPDVILVGEMRDLETISIAVTAAETGHLVLSTLHTTGAVSTIDRVIDVFPPHQQQQIRIQLAAVLQAVVSQQLVPTKDNKGRVAAFEILHINQAVRNLIREQKTHQILSIMQTNKRIGMQTMDDALIDLLRMDLITKEQALIFAADPGGIERRLV